MDRDAGEISELAQNRLAIGVGYSANACGGDAVTTGAAGAQHDQLYQLSSSGVTKVSALPDTLTTPLGEFVETVCLRLAGGYPSTGAALPVSRKLPGRGLLLSGWESITRDTALVRSCGFYFAPQRLHIGADVWGNTGNSVRHLRG